MVLQLSIKKLLKPLVRLSIVVLVILGVGFSYAGGYDPSLLSGFIIIICIPTLPTLYLLTEYYFVTKNQLIEIDNDLITIVKKNGNCRSYKFEDLQTIKLFKSAGMEKGSFPYQTAEMYYHAEIFPVDGNKIIITSIIEPGLDEALSLFTGIEIEVVRTVYSTIYI